MTGRWTSPSPNLGLVTRVTLAYHAGLPMSVVVNTPMYYVRRDATVREIQRRCPYIEVEFEQRDDRTMAHFHRTPKA